MFHMKLCLPRMGRGAVMYSTRRMNRTNGKRVCGTHRSWLDNFITNTGQGWHKTERMWRGYVTKQMVGCGLATGSAEWGVGNATSVFNTTMMGQDGVTMGGATSLVGWDEDKGAD